MPRTTSFKPKPPPPLRADVKAAAIRLFAQKGYAATGIREIGAACGLSSSALYHYGSKEDLLFGIMRDGMDDSLALAKAAMVGTTTPTERVMALVRSHVVMDGSRRLEALVTEIELRALPKSRRAEIVAARDVYEELWREAVVEGIASGEFRVADPKLATIAAIELCTSVSKWYSPRGRLTLEQIADTFSEFILGMLRDSARASGPAALIADSKATAAGTVLS